MFSFIKSIFGFRQQSENEQYESEQLEYKIVQNGHRMITVYKKRRWKGKDSWEYNHLFSTPRYNSVEHARQFIIKTLAEARACYAKSAVVLDRAFVTESDVISFAKHQPAEEGEKRDV